jgi:hypothetical protein
MVGTNGGFLPTSRTTLLLRPNCTVVPTARLDDIVSGPLHFIKADIEGAEYLALKGAVRLIERWRPIITSEFSLEMISRVSGISGRDFLGWFSSLGYRAFLLDRTARAPQQIEDVDSFLAEWGHPGRFEDLAFLPIAAA